MRILAAAVTKREEKKKNTTKKQAQSDSLVTLALPPVTLPVFANYDQWSAYKQQIDTELAELEELLFVDDEDGSAVERLQQAVSEQRWWFFKDKTEILYDSHTGYLWPNSQYVPPIKSIPDGFSLSGVGSGEWLFKYASESDQKILKEIYETYPHVPSEERRIYIADGGYFNNFRWSYTWMNFHGDLNLHGDLTLGGADEFSKLEFFPHCTVYANRSLAPHVTNFTPLEKAQMVLDFFQEQQWKPVFTDPEQLQTWTGILRHAEIERILSALDEVKDSLPKPVQQKSLSASFDYTQPLKNYNLSTINQSVWQYAQAAQRWTSYLLALLDDWSKQEKNLLIQAQTLNAELANKLPLGKALTEDEQTCLMQRRQTLRVRLNFTLEPARAALLGFRQQNATLESDLLALNRLPDSQTRLAQLAQQPRPAFELLAEHTAMTCTLTLQKLEWLQTQSAFVESVVDLDKVWAEKYTVFTDKYHSDLLAQAAENSIEPAEVEKWFAEWRRERLQLEKQWLPLVEAGLDHLLTADTVQVVLESLSQFQEALDEFYLQTRFGIHSKFAFVPNGHRQEKLEKELELAALTNRFMTQLQTHIFATSSTAEKVWLVRWAEIWQRDNSEEVIRFLEGEQMIERGEISQVIMTEMRQLQQRTLESCLEDAKAYSEALKKREADYNGLIFRMRKELQKGQK